MNQTEARKLWVEALRSGEYEQGKEYLRTHDDRFCCLGVACELYRKHENGPDWGRFNDFGDYVYTGDYTGNLPPMVQDWLGLAEPSGVIGPRQPYGSVTCSLTRMNDRGSTFEQIADLIEAAPKGLFIEEKTDESN